MFARRSSTSGICRFSALVLRSLVCLVLIGLPCVGSSQTVACVLNTIWFNRVSILAKRSCVKHYLVLPYIGFC